MKNCATSVAIAWFTKKNTALKPCIIGCYCTTRV